MTRVAGSGSGRGYRQQSNYYDYNRPDTVRTDAVELRLGIRASAEPESWALVVPVFEWRKRM